MGDGGGPGERAESERPSWWRWELFAFLELFALCGFVFAQPVLDITGNSPEFFLFHQADAGDILALLAAFTLVPPVALWIVGALTGLAGRRVRTVSQVVLLAAVFALLAIQAGKELSPWRGTVLVVVAVSAAVGFAALYAWLAAARSVLRMAAVGPVVFALLFVFVAPVSGVVLAGGERSTAVAAVTGDHPPVVLMIFDEFPLVSMLGPDGKVDAERYPHFAELAGESTWYRNGTAVGNATKHAAPAMLTGNYPDGNVVPHYVEYPENMFSLLGQVYDVNAFESLTQLCTGLDCQRSRQTEDTGFGGVLGRSVDLFGTVAAPQDAEWEPVDTLREPLVRAPASETGESQPTRFRNFLAELRPSAVPTLHYLHLLVPHSPLRNLASGTLYEAPEGIPTWQDRSQGMVSLTWQRHLQQARYADLLLGETVRVMRESGLYDNALLVVTSDHGISFVPEVPARTVDPQQRTVPELVWVPVFVKEPGQTEGVLDDRNWEQVDLLPTIADLAGLDVPWRTDGVAASQQRRAGTEKAFYVDGGEVRLTIDGPPHFATVLSGAVPDLPDPPLPELVGSTVLAARTLDGGPVARVHGLDAFADVRPDTVPAVVHGTLPAEVPDGTPVVVAVNGRIGAVVAAGRNAAGARWFGALITDEGLFVPGVNRLELFLVEGGTGDGNSDGGDGAPVLRRLTVTGV